MPSDIPSIEGFDDEPDQDALNDDSPGEAEAPETVVRLDDEPVDDFGVNDEGEDFDDEDDEDPPVAPVAPIDAEEPAPKKKGGRVSKGATPAKTPAKTPKKATTKTPRSAKSAATPASATTSKKRKAEQPAAEPVAKRGRGRAAASTAAAAIKESVAKRPRAPNGTAKAVSILHVRLV